jgi:hypothetical protein
MNGNIQRRHALAIDRQQWATKTALAVALVVAGMIAVPGIARAESNVQTGAGALTATAHLDFQIVIPRVLFLQVGTGTYLTNNVSVDRLIYDLTATPAIIGNGVQQTATSGGDVSNGVVTARVMGNSYAANATLSATTGGALASGTDTISWSEIAITTAAGVPATTTNLAHPGTPNLSDAGSTTVTLTPVLKVINQTGQWTFKYKNTNIPAAGTYGATGAAPANGRVLYSIAMP